MDFLHARINKWPSWYPRLLHSTEFSHYFDDVTLDVPRTFKVSGSQHEITFQHNNL